MLRTYFQHIHFEWPWMLLLLLIIPILGWYLLVKKKTGTPAMVVSRSPSGTGPFQWKVFFRHLPLLLRLMALAFIIVAMARPVRYQTIELHSGKGIEIVLCMDVSGSMLAQDLEPNRLQAARAVARDFITRRKGDRIGLVVFAGQSLTLCPITTDHQALIYQLESIQYGILMDGTSIGSGLASSVDRLRLGQADSRIVVLLTDGEDTGGKMDPVTAKNIARTYGIKVYTIGVGTEGYTQIPYQSATGRTVLEKEKVSIDEKLLKQIAGETGGKYYRAKNTGELNQIYSDIDALEKSDIRTSNFYKRNDAFFPFLFFALALLLIEWVLAHTLLRKFP
ncbi:MAG TPA: VWA domain-containing protein [Phnomibacter sp.]|nr:VWA domain-containing protein [Phnomibacter sp.]